MFCGLLGKIKSYMNYTKDKKVYVLADISEYQTKKEVD